MPNPSRPSGLELQALSVLYSLGPSTVAVVLENIPDGKNRAYTTILSVMQSLERKGLVKPTRKGRSYIYKPTKSQVSIVSPHVKDFLLNAFGGSICHAILHLLSTGALTPEEQTAVERNLNKQRAMAAKKKTTKRKAAAKRKPAKKAAKRSPAKKKAAKRKPFVGDPDQCFRVNEWGRIKETLKKSQMPTRGLITESVTHADFRKNQPVFCCDKSADGWSVVRFLPEEIVSHANEDGSITEDK